jgi:(1->4)-alpha-D-glucan 1-alpha-D-glucosylmutase
MLTTWRDGRVKQFVIARLLALRKKMPRLFSAGSYLPLAISGPEAERVVAFARTSPDAAAVVAFCRFNIRGADRDSRTLSVLQCSETRVAIPGELQGIFSDILRSDRTVSVGSTIAAQKLLDRMPIVALVRAS